MLLVVVGGLLLAAVRAFHLEFHGLLKGWSRDSFLIKRVINIPRILALAAEVGMAFLLSAQYTLSPHSLTHTPIYANIHYHYALKHTLSPPLSSPLTPPPFHPSPPPSHPLTPLTPPLTPPQIGLLFTGLLIYAITNSNALLTLFIYLPPIGACLGHAFRVWKRQDYVLVIWPPQDVMDAKKHAAEKEEAAAAAGDLGATFGQVGSTEHHPHPLPPSAC